MKYIFAVGLMLLSLAATAGSSNIHGIFRGLLWEDLLNRNGGALGNAIAISDSGARWSRESERSDLDGGRKFFILQIETEYVTGTAKIVLPYLFSVPADQFVIEDVFIIVPSRDRWNSFFGLKFSLADQPAGPKKYYYASIQGEYLIPKDAHPEYIKRAIKNFNVEGDAHEPNKFASVEEEISYLLNAFTPAANSCRRLF